VNGVIRGALLIALLVTSSASAQPARWSAEAWIEDLDFLRLQIGTRHGNPFHAIDGKGLTERFEELRTEIPLLSDFEIAIGIQRLMASLGDGHSWLNFTGQDLARHFMFDAWAFSDGIYITRAGAGYERAIGTRITAIDGLPIDEVRSKLAPYISRDNDMDLLRQVPLMIRIAPLLQAAGIARNKNEASFSLTPEDGDPFNLTFQGVAYDRFLKWYRDYEPLPDAPLYLRDRAVNYQYRVLPDERAIYFQFNRFLEMREKPFEDFVDELFETVDENSDRCLIIDARRNDGGWISLVDTLVNRLRKHPRLKKRGYLYVITGRDTFSAALMLCVRLERSTGVLFAGEPGRGKPNSYSELGPFELPNTGIRGSLSTVYHEEADPLDTRAWVDVDLPAPLSYADFRVGRDPALDAVLNYWRSVEP